MSRRGGFVGLTLRRPVSVFMVLTAALAVAALAVLHMPVELIPEGIFGSRNLHLSVRYSGASPREIEEEILKPIEEALGTVPDISEVWSTASENIGEVRVRFTERADLDVAYVEVRDRMERIKQRLPREAEPYRLRRRGGGPTDFPVIWMGLRFKADLREVSPLIDDIVRRKLDQVDGVANARIWGLAAEEVRIELDADAAQSNDVNLGQLVERLRRENAADISGGHVFEDQKKFFVRTRARFQSLDEIRRFPVQEGLCLGEIARVSKAYALQQFAFRTMGQPAVGIAIFKESTANTVGVCERVEAALEEEIRGDPRLAGLEFRVFWNQGTWIQSSLGQLRDTAIYGALFALVILYLFLRRFRMTLLITAAIPISALTGLGVLYFSGRTLNMLSLLGFTVAVGMLVDNSVVVVENIFRRRNDGESADAAAELGARQVGLAIFMSTLTTLVVFLPFLFMIDSGGGRAAFLEMFLPLAFSLLASLGVSLGVIPLATVLAVRKAGIVAADRRPGRVERFGAGVNGLYVRSLDLTLRHRFKTALFCLVLVVAGFSLWSRLDRKGAEPAGRSSFNISLRFPKKFSLREASDVVADYEKFFLERVKKLRLDFVYARFTRHGGGVSVMLENLPSWTPAKLAKLVTPELPEHAGVERHVRFEGQDESDDVRTSLPIHVFGPDSRVLRRIAADLKPILAAVPGVIEVKTEEAEGLEEIHLRIDRTRAGKYQVDPGTVRGTIGAALHGARLLDFAEGEREIPMILRFGEEETEGLEAFEKFLVFSREGDQVPLESVADYTFRTGYKKIHRQNRRTLYRIVVRVGDPDNLWATSLNVRRQLKDYPLPDGYTWEPAGSVSSIEEQSLVMMEAALYAVLFVFLLMGILFESIVLPASVLVTIPTAFAGGVVCLWATGTSLDMIGYFGFIILVGIVVNTGIVMVDYVNRLRDDGMSRTEAVRIGAHHRLRPILMTALTTIAGLMPIAMSAPAKEGFDYLPMSRVVVGGLVAATAFSLYLVPVTYTLLDDLRTWSGGVAADVVGRFRG